MASPHGGPARAAAIRTFLIADVRGYTRFTAEHGDEAASRLATKFADIAGEGVEAWGGELVENGRIVANKRPRGRPPKHPRPLVVIDEVPLPPHLVA